MNFEDDDDDDFEEFEEEGKIYIIYRLLKFAKVIRVRDKIMVLNLNFTGKKIGMMMKLMMNFLNRLDKNYKLDLFK